MATRTWWAGFGINLKIVLEGDSLTVYHELVEEVPPDVTDYVDPDREKSRSIAIPAAGGCVSAPILREGE